MEKITDNLLSGISDDLTNKIELFMINNISDKETQKTIIDFINKSFQEGAESALSFYEKSKEDFKKQAFDFQKEFESKLLDKEENLPNED